jgi:hypothetical protein
MKTRAAVLRKGGETVGDHRAAPWAGMRRLPGPTGLMRGILGQALGVPPGRDRPDLSLTIPVDLTHPSTSEEAR